MKRKSEREANASAKSTNEKTNNEIRAGVNQSAQDKDANESVPSSSTPSSSIPSSSTPSSSGPSAKKKRKKTSPVWNHFTVKMSDDNKGQFAFCNYCDKKYVYAGSSNGGTGNLKNHLKSAHPEQMPANPESNEEKFEFSQENFRKALLRWIIMSDQPFSECTNEYFMELIDTLNPDAEIISDTTVKRDLMALFSGKVSEIKAKLKEAPGKFSFTLDAWTSTNTLPFMAIRAHWIDADWVYQTVLLDLCYIEGNHDGQNFCDIFLGCLERFEIPLSKVLALTMDNVGSNDTFIEFLKQHGVKVNVNISSAGNRVRCMPHILNLSVQDILAALKIPLNFEEDMYRHLDEAEVNGTISAVAEKDEEEAEDDDVDPDEKDCENQPTIPKLRKLVKKIRKSPQKRQQLMRMCELYGIEYLTPIIDVSTRWNSTYNMIERAAYLKVPLRALCSNDKSLNGLCMKESEWKELDTLGSLLKKFDRSTKLMSMERHPSICAYVPTFNWLIESVESFISENPGPLADAAQIGLTKLSKYEEQIDMENSTIPYVAMFLNPALKMSYFKEHDFTKARIRDIQKSICENFEKNYGKCTTNIIDDKPEEEQKDEFFEHMFKRAKTNKEPKEFQKYMNFPLSSAKVDLLDYWRSQKEDFPGLSAMARDYLAVQSSSVAVERDFSMGTHLISKTRCCLKPETIRACMCCKSWLKNLRSNSQI